MAARTFIFVCAQVLLAQCIFGQFIGSAYNGLAWDAAGWGDSFTTPRNSYADFPVAAPWSTYADDPIAAPWNAYADGPIAASWNAYADVPVAAPWNTYADGPITASWNAYADVPIAASWVASPCATTPFATAEWVSGYGPAGLTASNGGTLPIFSASSVPPTGISMTSENIYEGLLSMAGAAPFLGAIALEGVLPTAGTGVVTYGCGNGNIAMVSEDIAPAYGPYGYGPELGYGYPGVPFEAGIAGPGYGYNRGYGCGIY